MDLPDLPYDNIHKFLSTIGFILILAALFVEPVYLDSPEILSVGAVAMILGLLGWGIELLKLPYVKELNQKGNLSYKEKRNGRRWSKILRGLRFVLPITFIIISAMILL
ncbi:hypothetical protein [Halorhabdus utahensis]|nr:hypothetical protein [Halorhabdus utahensis]